MYYIWPLPTAISGLDTGGSIPLLLGWSQGRFAGDSICREKLHGPFALRVDLNGMSTWKLNLGPMAL